MVFKDEQTVMHLFQSFNPQYQDTNSPYWSAHISYSGIWKRMVRHQDNSYCDDTIFVISCMFSRVLTLQEEIRC